MIQLVTFGPPSVVSDDGTRLTALVRQPKRLGLLVYIAASERRHVRRDELLSVFWPESDEHRARNCLRQSLHVLRAQLGPAALPGNRDQDVHLAGDQIEADVRAFVRALGGGFAEAALELYRDDFLKGFYLPEVPGFERWVEEQRQRLKSLATSAARQLAFTAEGTGDIAAALHWWERAAALAPYDEAIVRRSVSLLLAQGNRAEAIRTLGRFEALLQTELEVEPSRETLALLEHAVKGRRPALPDGFGKGAPAGDGMTARHWRRLADRLTPT
jgi:DNA-binding SARP family transcriptional activator